MSKWVKTDEYQRVLKLDDKKYRFVDIVWIPHPKKESYVVMDIVIDLEDYSRDEIIEELKPFGYDIVDVEELIIVECIGENLFCDVNELGYDSIDKAYNEVVAITGE